MKQVVLLVAIILASANGQTAEDRLRKLEQKQKEQAFSESERADVEILDKRRQNQARQRAAKNEEEQRRSQNSDKERLFLLTKAVLEQQVQLAQSALLIADLGRQIGELRQQLEEVKGTLKRAPFAPAR